MGDGKMKRMFFCASIISIIITIGVFTYLHLSGTDSYEKIDIYIAKNFNKEINNPIMYVGDKGTLKEISTIIRKSEKISGILNVASPEYILEIHDFNKTMKTLYLWLGKSSIQGMYMYKDNTRTGYSISEVNTEKLRKILITTNN
jgi:hypothetical protein